MKNKFRTILTLLLAIVMLFGVCAPTVAYAVEVPDGVTLPDGTVPEAPDADGFHDHGWLEILYDENEMTVTLYPDVDALLDINKQQVKDIIAELKQGIFDIVYSRVAGDIIAGEDIEVLPKEDLLNYVTGIEINGYKVFGPYGENGDSMFAVDQLKRLLYKLPKPGEIAEMTNEEMKLSYDVTLVTKYGSYDFTLTGVIGGGYEKLRKICQIVADHVEFLTTPDGTIHVDVTIPAVFHDAVIKACQTDKISDELKLKVFKALSKNLDEIEVFYNDFTIEDLVALIEAVDFEGILNSDFVKQYVDLTHLTEAQIIAKVREYEGYFNTAKGLVGRLFKIIPDRLGDNNFMDLYVGNGEFRYERVHNINVEDTLTLLSEKYGPLIASFINQDIITVSLDLSVRMEEVKRVQYVVDGVVLSEGFLPAGIQYDYIKLFAPVTEVDGVAVVLWVDENGNAVNYMPDRDIVLTAVLDKEYDFTVSGDVDKTYDGVDSTVSIVPGSTTATYEYQWYKVTEDGDVPVTTDASFVAVNAADSGVYYCVVTVTDGVITKTITSDEVTVNIAKAVISASDVKWSTPVEFGYDGQEKSVYAYGIDNVEFVYENDKATDAGSYVAKILAVNPTSAFDTANYELDPAIVGLTQAWSITPVTVDVSGAEWDYTGSFTYNGSPFAVALKDGTYPTEGVILTYGGTYTATAVGNYVASATFTALNDNYVVTGEVEDLSWTILTNVITVDVSALTWDYSSAFTYDGTEHEVKLTSVPEGVEVSYTDNKQTTAGNYTAKVSFTAKDGYEVVGSVADLEWSISKAQVDLSGITWSDLEFTYDGTEKKPTANIPDAIKDLITLTVPAQTNAGDYKTAATVELVDSANYESVGTLTEADWSIAKAQVDLSGITWSDLEFTYDGTEKKPTANIPDAIKDLITLTVPAQTNAGGYKTAATVELVDSANYESVGTLAEVDWSIAKQVIDLSSVSWADVVLVYNGNAQYVTLALPDDLPSFVYVVYEYYLDGDVIAEPVNAGSYSAKVVSISLDGQDPASANYELLLPESIADKTFDIAKADYVLSGVTFGDKVVTFDGQKHGLAIEGTLPDFITVTYSGADFYYIGSYTVTATFTVSDPNYNDNLAPMTATLTISFAATTEHVYRDDEGNIIIKVNSSKVPADHDFVVNNDSHRYTNVTLADGKNGVVVSAYDIYFAKDGTYQPISDSFSVSMRIPDGYKSGKTLLVVYIDENGEIEELEATVDGDYIVFATEHFSTYAIVSVEEAPAPAPERNLTWLWILLAIVIVLLLVVIILLLLRRRKDDGEPEGEPEAEPVVEPEGEPEAETAEETTEETVAEEPVELEPAVVDVPAEPEIPADLEPVEEPVEHAAEEPAPAEPAPAPSVIVVPLGEEDEDGVRSAVVDGEVVYVRYRSSFESRLIQSDNEIQDYYTVIKNALLSYKGVKSRTSWNFESFNKGRVQCAKLNVKGKALYVYLALDPKEYSESKYHFTDASDKPKFDKVPMLLKVKSDRSLKYVLELIEEMMNKLEIPQIDVPGVDYHMPYESTDALAKRGLVKVILPPGMILDENSNIVKINVGELLEGYEAKEKPEEAPVEAPVAEVPAEPEIPVDLEPAVEEPVHVDAVTADELLTDEEAEAKIEVVHTGAKRSGKLVEINLDVICENYEDGEVVDIDSLKAKKLINKNAGRIKVLARGTMTKSLTVLASKFSLQAVKMITLAGGVAEIED